MDNSRPVTDQVYEDGRLNRYDILHDYRCTCVEYVTRTIFTP